MSKRLKISILALVLFLGFSLWTATLAQGTTTANQGTPEVTEDENVTPQELGVSAPKILPGNRFYFLKNWLRGIQSFITFNPVKRAELRLRFANEKLLEAEKLAQEKKKPQLVEKALGNFQKEMERVGETNPKILKKFSDKLIRQQILHQKILERLESQVPPDVYKKIKAQRERHLERFAKVIQMVESKKAIPEKLENELKGIRGSRFKDFQNLRILKDLEKKMPKEVKERIEERREEIAERFAKKLDAMPDKEKERFKKYLERIPGNRLEKLKAISNLEGNEVSEKLRDIMESAKAREIRMIAREGASSTTTQKQIERAEKEISIAEEKVSTTSADEYGGRASRKLLELAKKHLDEAKKAFGEKKYGRAFALAISSYHEALNAERIVRRIGYIKAHPEKMRERIKKLYPGIKIKMPKNIAKCKIPLMKKCPRGEVMKVERNINKCPVFRCVPKPILPFAPSVKNSESPKRPSCKNLWWFDSGHKSCQQKSFCGLYMYRGLRTFQTKEECEAGLSKALSE